MRPYLARKRDTLNETALKGTNKSDLNHRTQPHTPAADSEFAASFILATSLTLAPLVAILSWLMGIWVWPVVVLLAFPTGFFLVVATVLCISKMSPRFIWAVLALVVAIIATTLRLVSHRVNALSPHSAFPIWLMISTLAIIPLQLIIRMSVAARGMTPQSALQHASFCLCLLVLSYLPLVPSQAGAGPATILIIMVALDLVLARKIGAAYAHWCAVNPCNDLSSMRAWQAAWAHTPLNYHVPILALAVTIWLDPGQLYRPIEGLVAALAYLVIVSVFGQILSFRRFGGNSRHRVILGTATWKAALSATTTWLTYNRHGTKAYGVFQLPVVSCFTRQTQFVIVLALNLVGAVALVRPSSDHFQWVSEVKAAIAKSPERKDDELRFTSGVPAQLIEPSQYDSPNLVPPRSVRADERRASEPTNEAAVAVATGTNSQLHPYALFLIRSLTMLFLPACFIYSTIAALAGPQLARYRQALEIDAESRVASDKDPSLPTEWDNRVERLMNSSNPREREHIYAGRSWYHDYPILIHRDLYSAHAHIVGDSGSGKTALGVAPLMTQLMARGDASHLIIDLKGDPQLFQCDWIEAERAGLPFKYFTTIPGHSSYAFNPFLQGHLRHRTLNQRTQNLLRSLSLDYGQEGYGRSYFSAMHETVLLNYLARYGGDIHSFRDLYRYVSDKNSYRDIGDLSEWTEARHLIALLNRVASIDQLNASPADFFPDSPVLKNAIDIAQLPRPEHKQVVYFYLPALEEAGTANAIAKLALFSLLAAAARREAGRKNGRVYAYLDEFQVIVGSSAVTILEQARSMNVSLLLSHQHRGQLNTPDGDLTPVIEANTRFKQIFKASDLDSIKHLEEESGEALYKQLSWQVAFSASVGEADDDEFAYEQATARSTLGDIPNISVQESKGPRLERNRIIELSSHPLASFIRTTQDQDFTQFTGYWTPIVSEYHVHKKEYESREMAAWPGPTDSTLIVPLESEHDNRFSATQQPDERQRELFPVGQQTSTADKRAAGSLAIRDRIRATSEALEATLH